MGQISDKSNDNFQDLNGYQKLGTQFIFDDETGEMLLVPIDITL